LLQAWWEESIRVLGDFHFLEYLLGYDKDAMTPDMVAQVSRVALSPADTAPL
jgi:dynein heavy chain